MSDDTPTPTTPDSGADHDHSPVTDGDLCIGEITLWHYLRAEDNELYVAWSAVNPMSGETLRVTEAMGLVEAAKFHMMLTYSGFITDPDDDDDDE